MPNATRSQPPKRLEEVRTVLRLHHDFMHTECSSGERIVRCVRCYGLRSRQDLFPPRPRSSHSDKKRHVPVVMTRAAVATILSLLDGTAPLVANLLYGSGVRLLEAVRLRVKDIDVPMKPLTGRSGHGDKDRCPTVPATLTPLLQNHLAGVKTWPQQESAQGYGAVSLPPALARKSPPAAQARGWPSVFPPGISPSTRGLASPGAIMVPPASSPRPSRWRCAVPV
jgi:integrase